MLLLTFLCLVHWITGHKQQGREQFPMLAPAPPELLWPGVIGDNWRPTFQTILKVLAVLCWSPSRPSSINSLRCFSLQCKLENLKIETRYVYAEWFLAEIGIGSSFHNIQQIKIKLIKVLRTRQHQKLQTFPCKFDV